jgi:oxygen-independent coproporphyrinogen-3 oxidase
MRAVHLDLNTLVFDSLYIGGGTPSILDGNQIHQIIEGAFQYFHILPGAEMTLEVNPGTVSPAQLDGYLQAGINRINIGVQSFRDSNLNFLGRIHSVKDANISFQWAQQAGFDNIGMDLIYGLPNQTSKNWREDLQHAVELQPKHLSCYMLTLETGTPMYKDWRQHKFKPATDGRIRQLFDLTMDCLEASGYLQYEISNFARIDEGGSEANRSRHNMKYWSMASYIGLGPSSHSFIAPKRFWNYADVIKYANEIEAGQPAIEKTERLTVEQMMMEAIYLGLRTTAGISFIEFNQRFGLDFAQVFADIISELTKDALLAVTHNHCALTRKGFALLDSIVTMFTNQDIQK